jgi:predicted dehydrogenase
MRCWPPATPSSSPRPPAHHHVLAMRAIAAGRHVFVEKPLAATLEQGREILAAARAAGLVLQVGHIERYSAAIQTLRASGAEAGR